MLLGYIHPPSPLAGLIEPHGIADNPAFLLAAAERVRSLVEQQAHDEPRDGDLSGMRYDSASNSFVPMDPVEYEEENARAHLDADGLWPGRVDEAAERESARAKLWDPRKAADETDVHDTPHTPRTRFGHPLY